ncbi:hypothetical protein BDP27DRAFT_1423718 [Rhodocollybia butyracea]|uniref:Uncharacterized protein n=1 Tax=Rhodocollybia butyracea TaxID=206335 RepID=A0A9P5U5C1_9AGAR|nr:hypothetical protein BDP27DRAFT_1423718 [Rhodocollybia butyracea]
MPPCLNGPLSSVYHPPPRHSLHPQIILTFQHKGVGACSIPMSKPRLRSHGTLHSALPWNKLDIMAALFPPDSSESLVHRSSFFFPCFSLVSASAQKVVVFGFCPLYRNPTAHSEYLRYRGQWRSYAVYEDKRLGVQVWEWEIGIEEENAESIRQYCWRCCRTDQEDPKMTARRFSLLSDPSWLGMGLWIRVRKRLRVVFRETVKRCTGIVWLKEEAADGTTLTGTNRSLRNEEWKV